jgi:hypothetical protein
VLYQLSYAPGFGTQCSPVPGRLPYRRPSGPAASGVDGSGGIAGGGSAAVTAFTTSSAAPVAVSTTPETVVSTCGGTVGGCCVTTGGTSTRSSGGAEGGSGGRGGAGDGLGRGAAGGSEGGAGCVSSEVPGGPAGGSVDTTAPRAAGAARRSVATGRRTIGDPCRSSADAAAARSGVVSFPRPWALGATSDVPWCDSGAPGSLNGSAGRPMCSQMRESAKSIASRRAPRPATRTCVRVSAWLRPAVGSWCEWG